MRYTLLAAILVLLGGCAGDAASSSDASGDALSDSGAGDASADDTSDEPDVTDAAQPLGDQLWCFVSEFRSSFAARPPGTAPSIAAASAAVRDGHTAS